MFRSTARPIFHSRLPLPLFILALLILVVFFIVRLTGIEDQVEIPVEARLAHSRIIESYPGGKITNNGDLVIERPSLLYRLLAPAREPMGDPINQLWFFGILLISYVYLRKLTAQEPFTKQTLTGMKALSLFTICVFFVAFARQRWLYEEVKYITAGNFTPSSNNLMQLPQLWIWVLLARGVQIFRKGYQLTLEQQYTV
jgi:hypothetical protein